MHCNASSAMHCNARWAEGGGIDQAWARSTLAARHHQLALNYFSAPPAGCKIISRKMQLVQDYLKSTTGALVKVTIASPLVPPNHQSVLKGDWIFNIHQRVQLHHHPDTRYNGWHHFHQFPQQLAGDHAGDQVSMPVTRHQDCDLTVHPGVVFSRVCVCFVFACVWRSLCLCVCVWRRVSSEYAIL